MKQEAVLHLIDLINKHKIKLESENWTNMEQFREALSYELENRILDLHEKALKLGDVFDVLSADFTLQKRLLQQNRRALKEELSKRGPLKKTGRRELI